VKGVFAIAGCFSLLSAFECFHLYRATRRKGLVVLCGANLFFAVINFVALLQ
jgi:hypothetical protein